MTMAQFWRDYRALMILCSIVLSICLAGIAESQTVTGTIRLSWTNPTRGCLVGVTPPNCTQPLTGADALTAINVYISTSPITDDSTLAPTLALPATATTATHTMQATRGQTVYVRVKAINASGASPFSNQVTKVISAPLVPMAPTSVTVEPT